MTHNDDAYYCDNDTSYRYCSGDCHNEYCSDCDGEGDGYRKFDVQTDDFISSVNEKNIEQSKRIYSAEIECNFAKSQKDVVALGKVIPKAVGIEHDGSLGQRGVEIVTPRLAGDNGQKLIAQVCNEMKKLKFGIDVQCGLHVHIDMSDIFTPVKLSQAELRAIPSKPSKPRKHTLNELKSYYSGHGNIDELIKNHVKSEKKEMAEYLNQLEAYEDYTKRENEREANESNSKSVDILRRIMLFYIVFEPVIASFLPMSRRTNRYCYPLSKFYSEREIHLCRNVTAFEKLWYRDDSKRNREQRKREKYDSSRYAGVNFHSLLKDGHIEVRFHSGTTQAEKILQWVALNVAIIDFCQNSINESSIESFIEITLKAKHSVSLNEKTDSFIALLKSAKLTESTAAYFKARQKKFIANNAGDDNE